jgi:hypothetical protein
MKSSIFWEITPCSPLKVNWHFWGTRCHHLRCLRRDVPENRTRVARSEFTFLYVGQYSENWGEKNIDLRTVKSKDFKRRNTEKNYISHVTCDDAVAQYQISPKQLKLLRKYERTAHRTCHSFRFMLTYVSQFTHANTYLTSNTLCRSYVVVNISRHT